MPNRYGEVADYINFGAGQPKNENADQSSRAAEYDVEAINKDTQISWPTSA
jgi:hypothetical protein